jgi:hypothetical protein
MIKKSLALIALTFIIVGAIIVIFTLKLPHDTYLWREIQNTGHTPLFGIVAISILGILTALRGENTRNRLLHYLVAFIGASILGMAVEIAQIWTPGDADIWDFLRDVAGELSFLGFYMLIDSKMVPLLFGHRWRKLTILAVATLILTTAIYPVASLALAYYERNHDFPQLVDFEHRWEKSFLKIRNVTWEKVDNSINWADSHGSKIAYATFYQVTYPTLFIEEPYPNWVGFDTLSFGVYSKQDTTIKLTISIEDARHNTKFEDRFNLNFKVMPGPNQINIPLTDIKNAPAKRKMDMSAIRAIHIFAYKPASPFGVYFDNFRLR